MSNLPIFSGMFSRSLWLALRLAELLGGEGCLVPVLNMITVVCEVAMGYLPGRLRGERIEGRRREFRVMVTMV